MRFDSIDRRRRRKKYQPRPPSTSSKLRTDPADPSPSSAGPQRAPVGPPRARRGRQSLRRGPKRPSLCGLSRRLGPRRHRRCGFRLRVCQQKRNLRCSAAVEPALYSDFGVVRSDGLTFGGVVVLQGGDDCERGSREARQGEAVFCSFFSFSLFPLFLSLSLFFVFSRYSLSLYSKPQMQVDGFK